MFAFFKKRATTPSTTPVQYATQQDNYEYRRDPHETSPNYSDWLLDPQYVVESCYSRETFLEWEFSRTRPRGQKLNASLLPAPGPYQVIDILSQFQVNRDVHFGRGLCGSARDKKNGRLYTTYPGVRFILVERAFICRGDKIKTLHTWSYPWLIKAVSSGPPLPHYLRSPGWVHNQSAPRPNASTLSSGRESGGKFSVGSIKNKSVSSGRSATASDCPEPGTTTGLRKGSSASGEGARSRRQSTNATR